MKLSIVTINLNNAIGLEITLQSILNQNNDRYELIVIDGNSKDNSQQIIEKYNSIISKYDAQNKGIKHSGGEYILFLNSGDALANNNIVNLFDNLQYKEDLIIGDIIFDTGIVKWRRYYTKIPDEIFFYLESIPHSSTFIKRDLLIRANNYDLQYKIVSDYDFFIKSIFRLDASLRYLNCPISIFDKSGISNDESDNSLHIAERNEVFIKYFGKAKLNELNKKKIYYQLFFKKIPYIYNFIRSYFKLNWQ